MATHLTEADARVVARILYNARRRRLAREAAELEATKQQAEQHDAGGGPDAG
jgi:hypothetical protein